ncbi:hypothetical protein [Natronospira bacteriovora]|uniref:DUF11 domain-containing protein n=1 Tax=Natronospira bacteriovora TaxID=3069753 RepID=A0ABU0W475_9GAMM|nr:hypothetical protein [Natronospira sp. AB-CW4]MDQ2068823.1 hypothetical protein [Natronospira sp. AB-CW4]
MRVLKCLLIAKMVLAVSAVAAEAPDDLLPSGGALVPAEDLGRFNRVEGSDDYVVIGNTWAIGDLGGVLVMAPDESGQWVEESWVPGTMTDASAGAGLGSAIAIDGDRFIVGAFNEGYVPGRRESGAAFEFRRDPSSGTVEFLRRIDRPEPDTFFFGTGAAMENGWLAVGAAFGEQLPDEQYGATYLFRWSEAMDDWEYVQKLLAPDREDGGDRDDFGTEVRMAYPWLAIAARNAWVADQDDRLGAIYLYRHDADSDEWRFEQKLVGDPPEGGRQPGKVRLLFMEERHVLMSGNEVTADTLLNRMHLYVYELDENDDRWEKSAVLSEADPPHDRNSSFGRGGAVFGDGERLAVTHSTRLRSSGEMDGALHIYERDDSASQGWALMESLTPPWPSWGSGHALASMVAPAGPEGLAALAAGTGSLGHSRGTVFVFQPEAKPVRLNVSDAWPDGDGEPVSGREFEYHWRVANDGPATATNVHLRLDLSSDDFTLAGGSEPCWWDSSADVHVCLIKRIPPGGYETVTIKLIPEAAGDYGIDSLVVSDQLDEHPEGREARFNLGVAEPASGSSSGCSLGRGPYELLVLVLLALARPRGRKREPGSA